MSDNPEKLPLNVDEAYQNGGREPRPEVSFVVEKENGTTHRYVCGHCGAPLFDSGTKKVLDCIFLCPQCDAINESPT